MRNPLSLRNKHGRLIRELRATHGITQSQLAGLLEIGRSALSSLESGDRDLGLYELMIVFRTFGGSYEDYMSVDPPEQDPEAAAAFKKEIADGVYSEGGTARRIAREFGDDGQVFVSESGVELEAAISEAGGRIAADDFGGVRWEFSDGTAIVIQGSAWDLGFAGVACTCWCDDTRLHLEDCALKGGDS